MNNPGKPCPEITGSRFRIASPTAPMLRAPSENAECVNECLFGEQVAVHLPPPATTSASNPQQQNISDPQWQSCIARRDGYQGFIARQHLTPLHDPLPAATHKVCVSGTLVFSQPSIKSTVQLRLPFLSHLIAGDEPQGQFVSLETGGFVWRAHLAAIDAPLDESALELAHTRFLGAPYLWGGCTPQGVDCSGLTQALAIAKGMEIPRDSADQEMALRQDVPYAQRQAEDLVYWPGHTGILIDAHTLLHATAHSLSCVIEPLTEVNERAGPVSSVKRLFQSSRGSAGTPYNA